MAPIASVIKYEGDNSTFVWKHPCEDFNILSQLIVHESQEALFMLNGQALDLFGPGRYTLETQNIPLISRAVKLATGGVSQVTIIGGDYKQYQILANPFRMQAYGVTMADLEALGTNLSVNSTGGVIRDYGNEYALRGMGRSSDVDELARTFVTMHNGRPVRLGDVAEVRVGEAPRFGYASCNATPAVILSVSKQPNINTLRVTENIEANLENIRRTLPADVQMNTRIFRQADFISSSVGNVGEALLEGDSYDCPVTPHK